jgi:hypothetical protein
VEAAIRDHGRRRLHAVGLHEVAEDERVLGAAVLRREQLEERIVIGVGPEDVAGVVVLDLALGHLRRVAHEHGRDVVDGVARDDGNLLLRAERRRRQEKGQ